MKRLIVVALVALVALAALITVGYAGPFGGRGRGDGDGLRALLKLDSATAAKIDKLRDDHRKSQIALRSKLDAARVDFRAQMRLDQPDEKIATAKQKEMSAIREDIQAAALAHRFAVGKLLTPEQRKLLKERRGPGFGMGGDEGEGYGMRKHRGRGPGMMETGCGGCCDNGHDARMNHRDRQHRHRMDDGDDD